MHTHNLPDLVNSFCLRIASAMSEGFSSVIVAVITQPLCFRSFEYCKTRIRFFCQTLDLRPRLPYRRTTGRTSTRQAGAMSSPTSSGCCSGSSTTHWRTLVEFPMADLFFVHTPDAIPHIQTPVGGAVSLKNRLQGPEAGRRKTAAFEI
jgi:hypothetical protein